MKDLTGIPEWSDGRVDNPSHAISREWYPPKKTPWMHIKHGDEPLDPKTAEAIHKMALLAYEQFAKRDK